MRLAVHTTPARFIERLNRFACAIELEDRRLLAHVANSGRMQELLVPGRPVYLVERPETGRKTRYDLALVAVEDGLVSVDARMPSALFREAFVAGRLPPFAAYDTMRSEVAWEDSRVDFMLQGDNSRCLVETKSVTLVRAGRALFPDAPTERGRKHIGTLARALGLGLKAAVVFVVQRSDVHVFSPNTATDPEFAAALAKAAAAGVDVYAYACKVSLEDVSICCRLPTELEVGEGLS